MNRFAAFRKRKVMLAATAVLALSVHWVRAQTECPTFFHYLAEGSLNDRFNNGKKAIYDGFEGVTDAEKLKGRVTQIKNMEYRLLQDAFYPIVNRFVEDVATKEASEFRALDKELTAQRPLLSGLYQKSGDTQYAVLDGPFHEATNQINYNVSHASSRMRTLDEGAPYSKDFVYSNPEKTELGVLQDNQFSTLVTPVGEYGKAFSERLLRTTRVMMHLMRTDPQIRELATSTYAHGNALLAEATARGKAAWSEMPGGNHQLVPLSSALEGVLSLHQLYATLLGKKIPGARSGKSALHDLIFQSGAKGLVAEATTRYPMGLVGPMALAGRQFQHSLIRNAAGELVLPKEIKVGLKAAVDFNSDYGIIKSRCPMAGIWKKGDDKPGLQKLSEVYWKIFSSLE